MLGERLHDGGGAPARAVVASCRVQGHDGPYDVCWRSGRGVLGSCRPCPDPGGTLRIIASPPLVEPTFRADQVPTDVLDLVVGQVWVEGLVTTGCGAVCHGRCLAQLSLSFSGYGLFSMSWHTACGRRGGIEALMVERRCPRPIWRRQHRCAQEREAVSKQGHGSGITP